MMTDIDNLAVAYALCSCAASCSRQCTICQSPTWKQSPCLRTLFENSYSGTGTSTLGIKSGPAQWVSPTPALPNPQNRPSAEKVEEVIDWVEENCIALQPWQAELLRTLLLGRQS